MKDMDGWQIYSTNTYFVLSQMSSLLLFMYIHVLTVASNEGPLLLHKPLIIILSFHL